MDRKSISMGLRTVLLFQGGGALGAYQAVGSAAGDRTASEPSAGRLIRIVLMDIGVVLGATGIALAAGRWSVRLDARPGALIAAVLGGLLMGYGARIAFGCTIGALVSGTASTSLHGWLWFAAVLPGVWVGARLRPRFGLASD